MWENKGSKTTKNLNLVENKKLVKKINFEILILYGLFNLNPNFSNIFFQKLNDFIKNWVQTFWKSGKNLVLCKFSKILIFTSIHLFRWYFTDINICVCVYMCVCMCVNVYICVCVCHHCHSSYTLHKNKSSFDQFWWKLS